MIRAMTDGGTADERLEQAARQRREAEGLRARLAAAEQHAESTAGRVRAAAAQLADEDRDVTRLERLSWPRVLSALRGTHATDHDRESAERDAARYRLADAEARDAAARRDVDDARARLEGLGDTEATYRAALDARERDLTTAGGSATASELAELAARRGALRAEDAEGREAFEAGMQARELLRRAAGLLDSARSWSTWDTFGGGGLLTDLAKYDRLDQVAEVLRHADAALVRFSRELADLRLAGVDAVHLDGFTRTFDVFFDNLFTDLAVRERIRDAEARVRRALTVVESTLQGLSERGREIATEQASVEERRERLLLG